MPYEKIQFNDEAPPGISAGRLNHIQTQYDASAAELIAHQAETAHVPYAVATGAANTYAVTISPAPASYVEGLALAVKINTDNTGASTINVNGLGAKTIKKPNGNDVSAGNLKAGSIYSLRYNGTNFILQGSDAAGNAVSADVLSGKTFSNDAGDQTGTMPNRGTVNYTPSTTNQAVAQGYHSGSGVVSGSANLVAGNIKDGVNIFGVVGSLIRGAVLSSIQYGTYTLPTGTTSTFDITVAETDRSKALLFVWFTGGGYGVRAYLSSSTNLRLERHPTNYGTTCRVDWMIVRFSEGVSVQYGVVDSPGSFNNTTVTISSVNQDKSIIIPSAFHPTDDSTTAHFNSDTQIICRRTDTTTTWKIAWQVASFN